MSVHKERNAETPLRWLAMSIVAVPPEMRGVQYLIVRKNMTESLERFGLKGKEAEDCRAKNMDMIRAFIREIEAVTGEDANAA
jgi:hypothetical protein